MNPIILTTDVGSFEITFDKHPEVEDACLSPGFSAPDRQLVRKHLLNFMVYMDGPDIEAGDEPPSLEDFGPEIQGEPTEDQLNSACNTVYALVCMAGEVLCAGEGATESAKAHAAEALSNAINAAIHAAFQSISFDYEDINPNPEEPEEE